MWPPAALAHLLQGSTCWVSGLSHHHTTGALWTPSLDTLEMIMGENPRRSASSERLGPARLVLTTSHLQSH